MYFGVEALKEDCHVLYPQSIIIYEFNFSDTINTLKKRIKQAILSFIDKVEKWLDNHKDSKVKSAIKSILEKARRLLTKSDNIKDQNDAKEVSEELNKCSKEFQEESNNISFEFASAVKDKKLTRIRIMLKDSLLLDKTFKKAEDYIKYAQSKGVNPFIEGEKDNTEKQKSEWDEDYMDLKMVEIVNNFTKERWNHLKNVVTFIYSEEYNKEEKSIK